MIPMKASEDYVVRNGVELVPEEVSEYAICLNCYFFKRFLKRITTNDSIVCHRLKCLASERNDKKNVIWIRKKPR